MSDVSVLSQEYKTASDLSRSIDAALIVVKKVRLGLPGAGAIAAADVDQSQRCLSDILDALRLLLEPTPSSQRPTSQNVVARVPGALVARLRIERQGDLAFYLEDLEGIAARLRQGIDALTESDLRNLDELAAVADAETSNVFRRLMRT